MKGNFEKNWRIFDRVQIPKYGTRRWNFCSSQKKVANFSEIFHILNITFRCFLYENFQLWYLVRSRRSSEHCAMHGGACMVQVPTRCFSFYLGFKIAYFRNFYGIPLTFSICPSIIFNVLLRSRLEYSINVRRLTSLPFNSQ